MGTVTGMVHDIQRMEVNDWAYNDWEHLYEYDVHYLNHSDSVLQTVWMRRTIIIVR